MTTVPLTSRERKKLRRIAQTLKPRVHVGKQGLSETALKEIDTGLAREGLLKVRFDAGRDECREFCKMIEEKLACECVGSVGKTAAFYRAKPVAE